MKPNRDIAVGKKGMIKDVHPSNLGEQQYTHAENTLTESQDGDALNLQNEDSNILCSRLLAGFYVVGFQRDVTSDRTYLFLTNPDTGQSEIGFIPEQETQQTFTDTIQNSDCDCDASVVLAEGLENIDQIATCTYTTLVSDYNCDGLGVGTFSFSVDGAFSVTPSEVNVIASGDVDNSGASGTGVSFQIITTGAGTGIASITVVDQGQNYQVGDVIVITGDKLTGGTTPADDITITLTANNCLNFNVNYPISSTLKDEKCGKVLYFTDDLNPRRRLEVKKAEEIEVGERNYYYNQTVDCQPDLHPDCDCGTRQESTCMNCDRLEVLPNNEPFCFDLSTENGGNVRHGNYAFFGGYCDSQGNLMTNILTSTGMVSIKNQNKNIYQQPKLDEQTNLAIKLEVSNLDLSFDYYKVIVLQRSSVDGANSFYTVGVYPTSNNTVTFTGENNLQRSDINEVTTFLPNYTKAKTVEQADNTLYFSDLEARPDPNLQPVVNFIGQFAKWRTVTANEDLYADGRGTALFLGYMRDEVVPFSIRFKTNTGYVTPNYPLIGRHIESADSSVTGGIVSTGEDVLFEPESGGGVPNLGTLEGQVTKITNNLATTPPPASGWDLDVYSILNTSSSFCTPTDRNQKWQYYNTACPASASVNYYFNNYEGLTDAGRSEGFKSSVVTATSGSGVGMTLDLYVDSTGTVTYYSVVNSGSGYVVGDKITISSISIGSGTTAFILDIAYIAESTQDLWKTCYSLEELRREEKTVTKTCTKVTTEELPNIVDSAPIIIDDPEGIDTILDWIQQEGADNNLPNGYILGFTTTPNSLSATANETFEIEIGDTGVATSGVGVGASFRITIDGAGTGVSTVEMTSGGSGFAVSDTITISSTSTYITSGNIVIEVTAIGDFQTLYDNLEVGCNSPYTGGCDPADLFDGCTSIVAVDGDGDFNIINLISSGTDSIVKEEVYLACDERDSNGSSINYPRIVTPSSCNNVYVPSITSSGNVVGNNLNFNGSFDYWLKRTDGSTFTAGVSLPSGHETEDYPCITWDTSVSPPVVDASNDCEGVGGCSPTNKHPAYFERVSNYLGNTTRPNAYSINPAQYSTVVDTFKIIPFFDGSGSSLCDGTTGAPTSQSTSNYETSVSAVAVGTPLGNTDLVSYVNNDHNSPNVQKAPDSVCGANCGYDQNDVDATFLDSVHRNAVWYKVDNIDDDTIIINVSTITDPPREFRDCLVYSKFLRLSVYDSAGNQLGVNGNSASTVALIDLYGNSEDDGVYCVETAGLSEIYFAIDAPLITITATDCHEDNVYLTGTQNCLDLGVYAPTLDRVIFYEADGGDTFTVRAETTCIYQATCDVPIDDTLSCDPYIQDEGCFAFWQSTETYPNNEELWNSKEKIGSVNLTSLPSSIRYEFERLYTDSNGTLTEEANFACKPIRHFKFPDFNVNPFFNTDTVEGQDNKIHPIGIWIDNEVIETFLDLAVTEGLISQDFRDSITHYELFRGDTKLNKSIVAKGLTYDMYSYEESQNENKTNWFSNFPYNDLSENKLIFSDDSRTDFIDHPNEGEVEKANKRFTFHSPETHYEKPNLGFEYYFESYFSGFSRGSFSEVNSHPTMTILTQRAFNLATFLATTEIILDVVTNTANFLKELTVGLSTNIGSAIAIGIYTASAFGNAFAQGRIRKQEWLNIFYNNADPNNFAYYYSSVGNYNNYLLRSSYEGNKTRGLSERLYLRDGIYRINERGESTPTVINNKQRESSVYLQMLDSITPSSSYASVDDSRKAASSFGCGAANDRGVSDEYRTNIASPYVSIKNYVPAQYGTINSIKWINTGYCGVLSEDNSCDVVFGGDTFISRFALKRKYPFFLNAMIDGNSRLPDLTPFIYSRQRNVGYPKYYVNYLATEEDAGNIFGIGMPAPVASTEYEFDCLDILNEGGSVAMSVQSGSKFYLYYYGIPSFLVESRINNNFRYGENETNKDFYPNQQDYVEWTQEKNVSIREDNYFFYNNIYSTENDLTAYRTLPDNYDEDEWACRFDHWDRVIYSLPDNNEQDLLDNFRVFKANNYFDFGNKYGTFYGLKTLENEKVLARFENGATILNAFNTIEGSSENISVGQGNIFQNRPTTFYQTELGYGGTQHRAFVSCEFGHFWTDAKRGRVFHLQPNAGGLKEVSRNGMKNWFRENLPFRIKKDFPNIPDDMLDNAYDGIGITMVWDDRNSRLIITKKDYILKDTAPNELEIRDLDFYYNQDDNFIKVDVTNTDYFEDCSWTVSYSPITESFVSFHSYKPNYYIPYQNYFSSGLNTGNSSGIWNHLLGSNQTFQVYYGTLYPWTIELPVKKNYQTKMLEDISYRLDVRRYNNEYDYGYYKSNFNTAVIYNDREATGQLNLITGEANNLQNAITYPRQSGNSTDIIATLEDYTWSFNYLMDNLKDSHTLPIWVYDPNNVEKNLNANAFDYRPTFKNHMRGQWFLTRFTQDQESRLKYIFEHLISDQKDYDAY